MSEVERRFQQRGSDVQACVTKLSTMVSTDRTEDWKQEVFKQLHEIMERLNDTIRSVNLIDEVNTALHSPSGETRRFFDEKTNRFGIKHDDEFDDEGDRSNVEEASSIIDLIFGCVVGMVQDTWIMRREEEERSTQSRLDRSRLAFEPKSIDHGSVHQGGGQKNSTEEGHQGVKHGFMMYENDTGSGSSGRKGIDSSGDETILNIQRANEQQMMLLTGMMKHMQQEAERSARSAELTAQIAQKREDRESKQEDQKMNFANQAAKLPAFMRPPLAKTFFGGKSVTEVSTAQLRKYFETLASFVETVDHEAGQLNALIKTVCRYTYRPSVRDTENNGVESMVAIATENYKNIQACHTKVVSDTLIEYGDLSNSTQVLDEQMYHFVSSQFDPTGSELVQYRARTKEHPQLTLYSELMLYLFHTKAGSPIHMWSTQQDEIGELERRVPTDIRTVSMSAMRESFGALLDELEVNSLEPWQVAVVKLHAHAVRTGCKDTTHSLEQNVLNFLANAQEGPDVKVPNVRSRLDKSCDGRH